MQGEVSEIVGRYSYICSPLPVKMIDVKIVIDAKHEGIQGVSKITKTIEVSNFKNLDTLFAHFYLWEFDATYKMPNKIIIILACNQTLLLAMHKNVYVKHLYTCGSKQSA